MNDLVNVYAGGSFDVKLQTNWTAEALPTWHTRLEYIGQLNRYLTAEAIEILERVFAAGGKVCLGVQYKSKEFLRYDTGEFMYRVPKRAYWPFSEDVEKSAMFWFAEIILPDELVYGADEIKQLASGFWKITRACSIRPRPPGFCTGATLAAAILDAHLNLGLAQVTCEL